LNELGVDKMDKNSLSYKVVVQLILELYIIDPKPSPMDIITLLRFLKQIGCKEPKIFDLIIKRYFQMADSIRSQGIHFGFLRDIGRICSFNFDVKALFYKVKPMIRDQKPFDKAKLFISLARLDIGLVDFFFKENMVDILATMKQSEVYMLLITFYYLGLCRGNLNFFKGQVIRH
jgi:hypothetical protein